MFAFLDIKYLISHIYRIDVDGTENIAFPDGTKVIVDPNGGNIDDRPHVCFNFCYVYLKTNIGSRSYSSITLWTKRNSYSNLQSMLNYRLLVINRYICMYRFQWHDFHFLETRISRWNCQNSSWRRKTGNEILFWTSSN